MEYFYGNIPSHLVELHCVSTFEGSKSNCMDPDLGLSSFIDGSGMGSLLNKS